MGNHGGGSVGYDAAVARGVLMWRCGTVNTGLVLTPDGVGRFVVFDPVLGVVVVEMDHEFQVAYPGQLCYPV